MEQICIGVVTVSDTRSEETDRSGPAAVAALERLGYSRFERRLVRDEIEEIQAAIRILAETCPAVFTTGGTGFSHRDVTPEATAPMLERRADSLVELMRLKGLEHTPLSHLSRGVAGIRGRTLIVNLPGSPKGAAQGIEAIGHLLDPILDALASDNGLP
ncbi:MogA/MoaB family molybdenum cofactor biosynthesis protein [Fimbriimonas ginsengisoli]|uniref:Molybdenum cofactor biosynthesis protein MoaB n=1 Tax=Fimbriimonas ginsengisoli Gsoil 348 TaxID=661478 RepID=A0A068NMZ7_FIMGI|nr:MogA/MoaB family molybdenum cofactor biosynthesis protein [Fimbriimonas ginsengisoli]AIE84841.1 Molybdenum cofactor biosynthesis protein MoaB [Fimbriimonas ginsengisoli Gsoil 348]